MGESLAPTNKKDLQQQMRSKLTDLPAPLNEVEISMPELEAEDSTLKQQQLEEDAADADARRAKEHQQKLEEEKERRSQAVKQGLPRPALPHTVNCPTFLTADDPQILQQAETLLHEEMTLMTEHDAVNHPMKGVKPPKKQVDLMVIPKEELHFADELLDGETKLLAGSTDADAVLAALEDGLKENLAYLPSANKYVEWRMIAKGERLEAAKHMFELAETQVQRESKRSRKLEEKLDLTLGGFMQKARQSIERIKALYEEKETIVDETEVFRTLRAREETAIQTRVEEIDVAVQREKDRNAKLQARYKNLKNVEKIIDTKLQ